MQPHKGRRRKQGQIKYLKTFPRKKTCMSYRKYTDQLGDFESSMQIDTKKRSYSKCFKQKERS